MGDRLGEAGAAVVAASRLDGDVAGELELVARRAGRQRRRRRWLAGAGSASIVLAAVVVLVAAGVFSSSRRPDRVTVGAGSGALPVAVTGPAGWQPGDTGNARVWVPGNWTVASADTSSCPFSGGLLEVQGGSMEPDCASQGASGPTVALRALSTTKLSGPSRMVNGYRVITLPAAAGSQDYAIPALGAELVITGTAPAGVLASVGPSPAGQVLLSGLTVTAPLGWQTVRYQGVQVQIPDGWPVEDAAHAGGCGSPFDPFRSPTAYVGEIDSTVGCPGPATSNVKPADGLLLAPGYGPSPTGTTIRTLDGTQITLTSTPLDDATINVTFHDVGIEVGIGPDPETARTILSSIRPTTAADTSVTGVCPPATTPAMPTPTRLATQLVLNHGGYTLNPPAADDQPAISAAQAWAADQRTATSGTYRLVLAKLSATIPATVVNGKQTPLYTGTLVWAILLTPRLTSVGDCGIYGITPIDASTGQALFSDGYSPGP